MSTENEKLPAKPTGRKYESVRDLMGGEGVPQEVQEKVEELRRETRATLKLAVLRQSAGITQEEMAAHLGVTQSAISKLESGRDEDVTLREIKEYARATNQRIGVLFGKPLTHVEAVQSHAFAIKSHLEDLAKIANNHDELEKEIKGFFGEAFFNILSILSVCGNQLPPGEDEFEIKVQLIKNQKSAPSPRSISTTKCDPVLV